MSEFIIEAAGVQRSFGDKRVLNGVDLRVPMGSVVGLLGTNGAGKSTLIKCLVGLLRINGGTASILGEDPWTLSADAKSRLGFVAQEIKLYPWMTAAQTVRYTGAFYSNWDEAHAMRLMRRWAVPTKGKVGTFSAGELQRLALVLASGHRPELLILDEPVASLDPLGRREFLRSLVEVTEDEPRTVVFSTHITSDLERVASHVAFLQDGVISFFGELDELKDRVKRLRITADTDLPATFDVDGALRTEVSGRSALVAVPVVNDELIDSLSTRWQASVAVEDLNLEEIFLEMHDGE